MATATLRAVGGSVMVAVPKRILDLVQLQAGSQVNIDLQHGQLIISPIRKKRYTLAELVAQCDPSLPLLKQEQEWLDAPAVGLEADAEAPADNGSKGQ
jgi:antitoxin ChpS